MATRADVQRLRIDLDNRDAIKSSRQFTQEIERTNQRVTGSNKRAKRSFDELDISLRQVAGAAAGPGNIPVGDGAVGLVDGQGIG